MNKGNKTWTLITALEEIWSKGERCALSETFYKNIEAPASYIKEVIGVDAVQSLILAVLIDSGEPMSPKEIGEYVKCSNILMMTFEDKFEDLKKRKMIRRALVRHYGDHELGYEVEQDLLLAIRNNCAYQAKSESDQTAEDILRQIGQCLMIIDNNNRFFTQELKDIITILNINQHITFCQKILDLSLEDKELLMLLTAAFLQIMLGHAGIGERDYMNIINRAGMARKFITQINKGETRLNSLNLLENDCNDGLATPNCFKLTRHALNSIFNEFEQDLMDKSSNGLPGLILPEMICEKNLFYNEKEANQVQRLTELLDANNFTSIQERLKAANMRPGFACLFYGSPGTGKTETVLQISRKTGRSVYQVNVSELKSKWVGDSEKLVQGLFDRYNKIVSESKVCPILLFNEADAIIGKRTTRAESSADKMENTLQNIILQAMERLNGIIIATTNLTENMDDAFERRFLYKIRFEKPEKSIKSKIWQSMLPDLNADEADSLSNDFDFSGGQIENIARKQVIETILYNNPTSFTSLKNFCEEECIKKSNSRKTIGFA